MELNNVLFAFGLTLLAGLSTGIGSALAFYTKQTNKKFLSVALGFSAGVMIYVSMIEIFAKSRSALEVVYGPTVGYWVATLSFFAGIAIIALIDKFVPSFENPHELRDVEEAGERKTKDPALLRMGMMSALAIGIHNFPEGAAVSIPLRREGLTRRKSFYYGQLSGVVEPVAGVIGAVAVITMQPILPYALSFAAGAMIYVVVEELIPEAQRGEDTDSSSIGVMLGFALMMLLDVALG